MTYPEDHKVYLELEAFNDPISGVDLCSAECDIYTAYKVVKSSLMTSTNGSSVLIAHKKKYIRVMVKHLLPTSLKKKQKHNQSKSKKILLNYFSHHFKCINGNSPLQITGDKLTCQGQQHLCSYILKEKSIYLRIEINNTYHISYDTLTKCIEDKHHPPKFVTRTSDAYQIIFSRINRIRNLIAFS